MRCKDVMKTDVKCCSASENVEAVARTMRDEGIGFVPVCDASGKPIGTLTDRDLAVRVLARGRSGDTRAQEVMTQEVISCKPDDDLDEAQELMADNQKSRIIVCDEAGKLAGIISLSDIAERSENAGDTLREVSQRETRPSVH